MKEKIFDFLLDNFKGRKPFDIVFIIMASLFIGFGIHWLYGARFKAQVELIEIKDQIIHSYECRIEILSAENKKLKSKKNSTTRKSYQLHAQ